VSEEGKAARDDDSDARKLNLLGRIQHLETEGRPVEAAALIAATLPAGQHEIEWIWVKGHAGHDGNERADALANRGVESVRI
jgi:ribonuclease HI